MYAATAHRRGQDCALCSAHQKAADRHKTAKPANRHRLVPWGVTFAVCAIVVPFIGDYGRWVALGLCAGLAAGAALAWLNQRTDLHFAGATLAQASAELKAEGEQRVAMVIRQFEWAVNDLASLRDALKRAQDAKGTAEANERRIRRRLRLLERQLYNARTKIGEISRALGTTDGVVLEEPALLPNADELIVPLRWRISEENMLMWLRFESVGIVPSQVRILNEHNSVIAISARSLDTLVDGEQTSLVLRAPDDVVAMLEGRHTQAFTFEALVDDSWCKVELSRSTQNAIVEINGHIWRPDNQRSQVLIA